MHVVLASVRPKRQPHDNAAGRNLIHFWDIALDLFATCPKNAVFRQRVDLNTVLHQS
jgi:hypothetical protein